MRRGWKLEKQGTGIGTGTGTRMRVCMASIINPITSIRDGTITP